VEKEISQGIELAIEIIAPLRFLDLVSVKPARDRHLSALLVDRGSEDGTIHDRYRKADKRESGSAAERLRETFANASIR
jgi:hypothetical protein